MCNKSFNVTSFLSCLYSSVNRIEKHKWHTFCIFIITKRNIYSYFSRHYDCVFIECLVSNAYGYVTSLLIYLVDLSTRICFLTHWQYVIFSKISSLIYCKNLLHWVIDLTSVTSQGERTRTKHYQK